MPVMTRSKTKTAQTTKIHPKNEDSVMHTWPSFHIEEAAWAEYEAAIVAADKKSAEYHDKEIARKLRAEADAPMNSRSPYLAYFRHSTDTEACISQ